MLLAVKTVEVATPDELVWAVAVVPPPAKVPLAPLDGAVNVTVALGTRKLLTSLTVTESGAEKAVESAALWVTPPVAVMDAGVPTTMVTFKVAVAVCCGLLLLSTTLNVTGTPPETVVALGVPLITPPELRPRPPGRVLPLANDHVYGVVPLIAVRVWEKGTPNRAVVTELVVIWRATTLTVRVTAGMLLAGLLAVMIVVPPETPVIGTLTLVVLAWMVTVAGTVATEGLLELSVTTMPPVGADEDKLMNAWLTTGPVMLKGLLPDQLSVSAAVTLVVPCV